LRIKTPDTSRNTTRRTPCQRLLESRHISTETKELLITAFLNINPFDLKKTIQAKT
jgi:hypothetical protein